MSTIKKRVYAVLAVLALTLSMGAYSHGAEKSSNAALESADPATGLWRMAGDPADGSGGG